MNNLKLSEFELKNRGWVYLLEAGGMYKIGITKGDVSRRVKGIQTSCPFLISVVCSWYHEDAKGQESDLHSMFERERLVGEWFNLSLGDVEYLKRHAVFQREFMEKYSI